MTPHSLSALAKDLGIPYRGTFKLGVGKAEVGLFDDTFIITSQEGRVEKSPSEVVKYLKEKHL